MTSCITWANGCLKNKIHPSVNSSANESHTNGWQ